MNAGSRNLATLVLVAAVLWHALSVLSPAWVTTKDNRQGRDFASYYYAVEVAAKGGDPYDKKLLNEAAREDGFRRGVHPFLYAPPFLLLMGWSLPYDLPGAFHLWFWLHELCAIGAGVVLWRWWRHLGPQVPWLVALLMALMTAIPNNHAMGQANFPGLLLALAGLWQTDERRPVVGGLLMGAACMLKMSPALFVVWWLVRREWTAVGASIVAAIALSVLTLPLAGPAVQLGFYTDVLPTFGSGWYNGLAVPIGMFGNHSVPNLLDQVLPSDVKTLSAAANAVSVLVSLSLVGGMALLFRAPSPTRVERAAQASAVGILLLLLPVYTYEHHLVFAIPAMVLGLLAVARGWLRAPLALVLAASTALVLFDLATLKRTVEALPEGLAAVGWLLQEAKFLALVGLLVVMARMGIGPSAEDAPDGP
jgi:alpha-1,2-mannosyltransferase